MGSGYAGVYEAYRGRKNAEKQASKADRAERERQDRIDASIRRVREMFGVDVDPDWKPTTRSAFNEPEPEAWRTVGAGDHRRRERTPEWLAWNQRRQAASGQTTQDNDPNTVARQNKAKLDAWLDDHQSAVMDLNNQDVNDQFVATTTANRWSLSDRGLLGGSVDAGTQRRQLSELVGARQKVVAAARDARRNVQQQLTNQRMNLEAQIASGAQVNPDFAGLQEQTQMGLETARSQIVPNAVGNAFTQVGGAVGAGIEQRGGRTPSTTRRAGSSSGTIT